MTVFSIRVRTMLFGAFAFALTCSDALAAGYPYTFTGPVSFQASQDQTQIRITASRVTYNCGYPSAQECDIFNAPQMELWAFVAPYPLAGTTANYPLPKGFRLASFQAPGLWVY